MGHDKLIGIGFLIFGIFFLWWTIKSWIKDDYLTANLKGLIAGVGAIIIGILLLFGFGKW
jgi:hypothetical protein